MRDSGNTGRSFEAFDWRKHARMLARPLGVFFASRLLVAATVEVLIDLRTPAALHGFRGSYPNPPPASRFFQALGSWDAGWYTMIAKHGYFWAEPVYGSPPDFHAHSLPHHDLGQQFPIAFFPLWPDLLRGVDDITGGANILVVGAILTLVVGAMATVAMWYLVSYLCDERVAYRAVALWVFCPGAFVLSMIYAEGLTVLCACVCILCLLKRRWVLAGVAAGVATGVQPAALVLIACCVWAAGRAVRAGDWKAIVAPILSLGGALGYFVYLWATTGDFLRWYNVERQLWTGGGFTAGLFHNLIHDPSFSVHHTDVLEAVVPSIGLIWVVICAYLLWKWRPPTEFWLFGVGVVFVALQSTPVGTRPRLLLAAFPLIVAVAKYARGRLFTAIACSFAGCLTLVTIVTLYLGNLYGASYIVP